MPELPDAELFKRDLDAHALNQTIRGVTVGDARILGDLPEDVFVERLTGNRLLDSRRHGKHLLVRLAQHGWLTLHFGMTGALQHVVPPETEVPYGRVRLTFDDGSLVYVNRRMLGRVGLADDADNFIASEGLGPDALDPALDSAALDEVLDAGRDLKTLLMDQALIAGIGNVFADEILFQARLHPRSRGRNLNQPQRQALLANIKEVLTKSIDLGAGAEGQTDRMPDHFVTPHRHLGGICPRCGRALSVVKVGGRTTYACDHCQARPA
ncbi:MAG: DNA-formamidopyrimidine glycosylase family protein [Pseudomonadota bacterium]